jgi:hypothetical protein
MIVENNFCPEQMKEVKKFLDNQKKRRTKDEIL